MTSPKQLNCPQCDGYARRIPRRTSDRIFSIFKSVHRYRCQHYPCKWEGTISASNQLNGSHLEIFQRKTSK